MKVCEVMTFSMIMTLVYVVVGNYLFCWISQLNGWGHWSYQPARELPASTWECHFTKGDGRRWSKNDQRKSETARASRSWNSQHFPQRQGTSTTDNAGSKTSLHSCWGWWKRISRGNNSHSTVWGRGTMQNSAAAWEGCTCYVRSTQIHCIPNKQWTVIEKSKSEQLKSGEEKEFKSLKWSQ